MRILDILTGETNHPCECNTSHCASVELLSPALPRPSAPLIRSEVMLANTAAKIGASHLFLASAEEISLDEVQAHQCRRCWKYEDRPMTTVTSTD